MISRIRGTDDASAKDFVVPIKRQRLPGCGRALVLFERTLYAPSGFTSFPSKGCDYEGVLRLQRDAVWERRWVELRAASDKVACLVLYT